MKTLKDLLVYYNNADVDGFVEAVTKMKAFYKEEKNIHLFQDNITLPGVARTLLCRAANENGSHFTLLEKQSEDLYEKFAKSIAGGPSIVFTRYAERDKTYINGGTEKVKNIAGLDINGLYSWALSLDQPTGYATVRRAENGFKKNVRNRYLKCFYWLEHVAHSENIQIQHAFNIGEKRIGSFKVDGFRGNTCYEFQGCWAHSHPPSVCPISKKFKKPRPHTAYLRTPARTQFMRESGFEVVEIWECQYEKRLREDADFKAYIQSLQRPLDREMYLTENKIISAVMDDRFYGVVECDIRVRLEHREYFDEMAPLFLNHDIPVDTPEVIGEKMYQLACEMNIHKAKTRRALVPAMEARKILLASPLLKWYISHGMEVTKIYTTVEFTPKKCFQSFIESLTEGRRLADAHPHLELHGKVNKNIGNHAFGSCILNKKKFTNVKYVQGVQAASKCVNSKQFRKLTELSGDYFEVEMAKASITLDKPMQIGFFILCNAKLRMLSAYYDVFKQFFQPSKWSLMLMDTDSYYMQIATETIDELVKPEMRESYLAVRDEWFPRVSPPSLAEYDRRRLGIFKEEARGDVLIALSSKSYCLSDDKKYKFACKGVQKKCFASNPIETYKEVLFSTTTHSASNVGFRSKENTVFSYVQEKRALSSFYIKRKVLEDGIRTHCLNVVLCPDDLREEDI